jgi:hypothetical protein
MNKRVLLVGLEYGGPEIEGVTIETRGLCKPDISQTHAASPLYDYDLIVIYPKSYSHYIFGTPSGFSDSKNELQELKKINKDYDLDTIFSYIDRKKEMDAALKHGTRVVWLATEDKYINFYGYRSLYQGYLSDEAEVVLKVNPLYTKSSNKLQVAVEGTILSPYFEQLKVDLWNLSWNTTDNTTPIALTPEGYCLGCEIPVGDHKGWLITPPTSEASKQILIQSVLGLSTTVVNKPKYHGIFLSHTSVDKPFVRELRKSLLDAGVENVWIDEAEIMIGDSLIAKIQEGIQKTKYFGIILSPRSIGSPWVKRELETAINMEITSKGVKVLPLIFEKCELPVFLLGKLYADFSTAAVFEESLKRLLKRLEVA